MSLITDEYRQINAKLHENDSYGAGLQTKRWFTQVSQFAEVIKARSILDYGAGKCRLASAMSPLMVFSYDPAIPELSATPEPHDLVVSLDVLEHIEPDCIDAVLDDIQRCALKAVFLSVALTPARKTLPDGRNAHILLRPVEWWLPKLLARWDLMTAQKRGHVDFIFLGQNLAVAERQRVFEEKKIAERLKQLENAA